MSMPVYPLFAEGEILPLPLRYSLNNHMGIAHLKPEQLINPDTESSSRNPDETQKLSEDIDDDDDYDGASMPQHHFRQDPIHRPVGEPRVILNNFNASKASLPLVIPPQPTVRTVIVNNARMENSFLILASATNDISTDSIGDLSRSEYELAMECMTHGTYLKGIPEEVQKNNDRSLMVSHTEELATAFFPKIVSEDGISVPGNHRPQQFPAKWNALEEQEPFQNDSMSEEAGNADVTNRLQELMHASPPSPSISAEKNFDDCRDKEQGIWDDYEHEIEMSGPLSPNIRDACYPTSPTRPFSSSNFRELMTKVSKDSENVTEDFTFPYGSWTPEFEQHTETEHDWSNEPIIATATPLSTCQGLALEQQMSEQDIFEQQVSEQHASIMKYYQKLRLQQREESHHEYPAHLRFDGPIPTHMLDFRPERQRPVATVKSPVPSPITFAVEDNLPSLAAIPDLGGTCREIKLPLLAKSALTELLKSAQEFANHANISFGQEKAGNLQEMSVNVEKKASGVLATDIAVKEKPGSVDIPAGLAHAEETENDEWDNVTIDRDDYANSEWVEV